MLEVSGLVKAFGNLRAVDGIDLAIEAGTITGLIGPNGAGKTTLFNLIAGALAPESGAIRFMGDRIDRLTPDRIFAKGLARTFQVSPARFRSHGHLGKRPRDLKRAGEALPETGAIRFMGDRIDRLTPDRIFAKGLARTFQVSRPFPQMTVLENLMLAPLGQSGERLWNNWLRAGRVRREEQLARARAVDVLELCDLA